MPVPRNMSQFGNLSYPKSHGSQLALRPSSYRLFVPKRALVRIWCSRDPSFDNLFRQPH